MNKKDIPKHLLYEHIAEILCEAVGDATQWLVAAKLTNFGWIGHETTVGHILSGLRERLENVAFRNTDVAESGGCRTWIYYGEDEEGRWFRMGYSFGWNNDLSEAVVFQKEEEQ